MSTGNVMAQAGASSALPLGQPLASPPIQGAREVGQGDFLSAMALEDAASAVLLDEMLLPEVVAAEAAPLEALPAMHWGAGLQVMHVQRIADTHVAAVQQDAGDMQRSRTGVQRSDVPTLAQVDATQAQHMPRQSTLGLADADGQRWQPVAAAAEMRAELPAADAAGVWAARLQPTSVASVQPAQGQSVPVDKGAQPLMDALAQRIRVQQAQGVDIATVRLDPPQMGSLEIRIRHDAAGVQVHLQASHAEVGRQLSVLVDSLRQELQSRHGEAAVTVAAGRFAQNPQQGDGSRHGQQTSQQHEHAVGQALHWDAAAA